MGLSFLADHGACRAGAGDESPDLFGFNPGVPEEADPVEEGDVDLTVERDRAQWRPLDVHQAVPPSDWPYQPRRYVDGKDVGRTVAWLQSADGLPVPVRLAQIGAITLYAAPCADGMLLRSEVCLVEKVVSFMADLFPWQEVESFAAALQAHGFRLLASPPAQEGPYDFALLRDSVKSRTINAMFGLERLALGHMPGVPTVIDGSLQTKSGVFEGKDPVTGVVKTHIYIPLHARGFHTLQALRPFQRTPVYERRVETLQFFTWFLRLGPLAGETPDRSVVRVEINRGFFEKVAGGDFGYVDRLSHFLCRCRTRDQNYGRAAITIYPIQRAEDLLRSHFANTATLTSRFFHMTGL